MPPLVKANALHRRIEVRVTADPLPGLGRERRSGGRTPAAESHAHLEKEEPRVSPRAGRDPPRLKSRLSAGLQPPCRQQRAPESPSGLSRLDPA
uniref:Uncharacterized protein n=1 Tax=Sphaerodactylus townsendi TaxID=933632 RepID=A0ACB8FA78_9SAUR